MHRLVFGLCAIGKRNKTVRSRLIFDRDFFRIGSMLLYDSDSTCPLIETEDVALTIHGDYYLTDGKDYPDINLAKPDVLRQFDNGMFIGVMYDRKTDEYVIFNSYTNHLPLYYTIKDETICFSSDLGLVIKWRGGFDSDILSMMEFIEFGTILTDHTICKDVKCLPKASCISIVSGKVEITRYYNMPTPETNSNRDWIEEFDSILKTNIKSIKAKKNIGLGLTGGIDSRVILSALINQNADFVSFTGSGPDDPDCIVAKRLCENLGITHLIEDYTRCTALDFADSYIEQILLHTNPLTISTFSTVLQYEWKQENNIKLCLSGAAGEIIGGDNYYYSRSTPAGILKMMLPYHAVKFDPTNYNRIYELIGLGCRGKTYLKNSLSPSMQRLYNDGYYERISSFTNVYLLPHIGDISDEQTFLERFRALYKHSNLLAYDMICIRDYCEWVSPFNSISMMNLAFRIPLCKKNDRKLLYKYLKQQGAPISNEIIVGSFLSPQSSETLFKVTKPIIKGLNHYGIKLPGLQPYIKPHYNPFSVFSSPAIQSFIVHYAKKASVFSHTRNPQLLYRYFVIALAEQAFSQGYESFKSELLDAWLVFRKDINFK